jgi:hypothetical protein
MPGGDSKSGACWPLQGDILTSKKLKRSKENKTLLQWKNAE